MQDANLVLDELVSSTLEKVAIENPTVVQRGRVVQGSPTLLVFCLNIIFLYTESKENKSKRYFCSEWELLGDELDQLGLVEEDGLV